MKPRRRGFTLIEMLLVIAIMTILMSVMVLPGKTFLERIRTKSALDSIVSQIRMARSQAITQSTTCLVRFEGGKIYISSGSGTKEQTLPSSLKLKEAVTFGFTSAGHPSESGTIVLTEKNGKEHRISVAVGTGRVRLY